MDCRYLLEQAYNVATKSDDQNTKNGALLVRDFGGLDRVLVQAANSFINPEMAKAAENHVRPRKYTIIEHAERAVIYEAARAGIYTEGLTLVSPWACCPACARAIVLSGITRVVAHRQAFDKAPKRWAALVHRGAYILKNAPQPVEFIFYSGSIGYVTNMFDGEIWHP